MGVDQNDSVLVTLDLVIFDQQIGLAFHHKDAFSLFRVHNIVVFYSCFAGVVAPQRNIGLNISVQLICHNSGIRPFNNQNSLIVVAFYYIRIRETFLFLRHILRSQVSFERLQLRGCNLSNHSLFALIRKVILAQLVVRLLIKGVIHSLVIVKDTYSTPESILIGWV